MASVNYNIETYLVHLYGGPGGNSGAEATIFLGIENARAYLRFYPDDLTLPINSHRTHADGNPLYHVNYHYKQLQNVIDILRNEKPVRFFFREDNLRADLRTGHEIVGEAEL